MRPLHPRGPILSMGLLLTLAGCGGGGSGGPHVSPYAATYDARITGQNTQGQQVSGTVSMTVSPDGGIVATVLDPTGSAIATLSGTAIGAGATLSDPTGKIIFYANFTSYCTASFSPTDTVQCAVPGVFGTWSNTSNPSSGDWSSTVPVLATALTSAQVSSIESGCAAEGYNQIFNPQVASSVNLCQLGSVNPDQPSPGTYSYTDSQGNIFSVLITSATGTDSAKNTDTSIFVAEVLPRYNLNVVSSWPSASVPIASFSFFEGAAAHLRNALVTRPAR